MRTSVPIFLSRSTLDLAALPGYGAFIDWALGEQVLIQSRYGRPPARATVLSEVRWHPDAPEIEGAHGTGQWVREVLFDGERTPCSISTAQIIFIPSA